MTEEKIGKKKMNKIDHFRVIHVFAVLRATLTIAIQLADTEIENS